MTDEKESPDGSLSQAEIDKLLGGDGSNDEPTEGEITADSDSDEMDAVTDDNSCNDTDSEVDNEKDSGPNILSNDEIGILLNTISEGAINEEEDIRYLDLTRQSFLRPHELKALQRIHISLADLMADHLNKEWGLLARLAPTNIVKPADCLAYILELEELLNSAPNPTPVLEFRVPGLPGEVYVLPGMEFSLACMNELAGGSGIEESEVWQPLSESMLSVLGELLQQPLSTAVQDAFRAVVPLRLFLQRVHGTPESVRPATRAELLIVSDYKTHLNGKEYGTLMIAWCLETLRPITPYLTNPYASGATKLQQTPTSPSTVQNTTFEEFICMPATASHRQLAKLKSGDCLGIDPEPPMKLYRKSLIFSILESGNDSRTGS